MNIFTTYRVNELCLNSHVDGSVKSYTTVDTILLVVYRLFVIYRLLAVCRLLVEYQLLVIYWLLMFINIWYSYLVVILLSCLYCRTGSEQTLSTEQSYQLLSRAIQVFREQHVNKLLSAKDELDRR